jgi:hypothetical protein
MAPVAMLHSGERSSGRGASGVACGGEGGGALGHGGGGVEMRMALAAEARLAGNGGGELRRRREAMSVVREQWGSLRVPAHTRGCPCLASRRPEANRPRRQ